MTDERKEFLDLFKKETGKDAKSYHDKKDVKGFRRALNNGSSELRKSYFRFLSTVEPRTTEEEAAKGLSALFGKP